MDYNDFLELVKSRRSIHSFKTEAIPDEYVEKIIEAARWAPSGANSQPWEFIVVKDKEIKDKIVDRIREYREFYRKTELTREEDLRFTTVANPPPVPGYKKAPVFIILCGDRRTREAYPQLTLLTRGESIFASSLASAFLYMHLAARTLGLGSQWVSATANPAVQCALQQLLKIPKDFEIYDMMAVGYPGYQPRPRMVRERQEMVHVDCYDEGKYRNDKQIRAFIASLRKA